MPVVTDSEGFELAEFKPKQPRVETSDQSPLSRKTKRDPDKQRLLSRTGVTTGGEYSVSVWDRNTHLTPQDGPAAASGVPTDTEDMTDSAVVPDVNTSSPKSSRLGRQDKTRGKSAPRLISVEADSKSRDWPPRDSTTKQTN